MYNIIQLNDKNLSELQAIAQELGIKKTDSLKKEELVYKILDEQAIAGATKKVAADKLKEERKGDKQKRSRVTVKKEGADKVFTANKNGDLTKGKAEETPAVQIPVQAAEAAKEPAVATAPAAELPPCRLLPMMKCPFPAYMGRERLRGRIRQYTPLCCKLPEKAEKYA